MQSGAVAALTHDPPPFHEWFERAAEQGSLIGAFNYAVCLAEGVGIPRNDERAAFWLKRAAEGVVNAQYWYGRMLAEGHGVVQDDVEAAVWFARAAEAGMAEAQVALAELYVNGRGVPRDHQLAKSWFLRAIPAGHAGAMFALGALHGGGHDLETDREEARRWFVQGAEHGHPIAALMLARYTMRGLGGPQDIEAGRRWYARSADLGSSEAADELAKLDQPLAGDSATIMNSDRLRRGGYIRRQGPPMMTRRSLLSLLGAGLLLSLRSAAARAISPGETLLTAPLQLGGSWGGSAVTDAAVVIERMRAACLAGVALLSDHQPARLRVDDRAGSYPAIWLHTDAPTTAWITVIVGTRDWCNLAYQFGHELGHVLCNSWEPDAAPRNPCQWIEEALVEAFSLRGLGVLADDWRRAPPFPNDAAYGAAIRDYRETILAGYRASAPDQGNPPGFRAWFKIA